MLSHDEPLAVQFPELGAPAAWFDAFAARYVTEETCGPLELKIRHTARVTRHAARITPSLGLSSECARAALLAALLHDTGRFPQFARWKTFRDPDSVNHGLLGARTVREQAVLENESPRVRRLALVGIGLHNRYALPQGLDSEARLITDIVRDADKIDILHIFREELARPEPSPDVVLHVAREPDKWSPAIARMVRDDRIPDYRDLKYVNDFIMLLCSWLPGLAFEESRRIVHAAGSVAALLDYLPRDAALDPVRAHVRRVIERQG
jgi:HD domain.